MSSLKNPEKTFKQLENDLAAIVNRVELGHYSELEDMLKDYEAAKKIIAELEKRLNSAKISISNTEIKKK